MAAPLLADIFSLQLTDADLGLLNDDTVARSLPAEFPGAAVFSLDFQQFLAAQHRVVQQMYESNGQHASPAASLEAPLPRCAVRVALAHSIVGDGVVGMTRSHRNVDVSMDLSHFVHCPPAGRATLDVYVFEPSAAVQPLGNKLEGERTVPLLHGACSWRVKINATSYNAKSRWSSFLFAAVRVAWPASDLPNAPMQQSQHVYVSLPFISATKPPAAIRQFCAPVVLPAAAAPAASAASSSSPAAVASPADLELAVTQSFPSESPTTGGVRVLLKGAGFLVGDLVVFDRTAVSATETSVNELICVAPPHVEGVVDLYVARPNRAGSLVSQSNRIAFSYEPSVVVLKAMYFELMARVDELERMRHVAFGGTVSPPLAPSSPTHYSLGTAVGGDFGSYNDAAIADVKLLEAVRAVAAKLDALSPLSDPSLVLSAAQIGDVELLRIVLPKDARAASACARYADENGNTALALALACNSTACMCVLLEYVSPSDKIDSRGRTLVGAALAHRPTPWPLLAAIRRVALTSRARARDGIAARTAASVRAAARVPRPLSPPPRPTTTAWRSAQATRSPPLSPPSSPPPAHPRQLRPVTTVLPAPTGAPPAPAPPPRVIESTPATATQQAAQSGKRLSQRGSNPFSSAFRLSQVVDLSQLTPAMWARPSRTGYLVKRGAVRKSWRTRYFVLQRTMLFYFRHNDDDDPLGAIPLKGATVAWATIEKGKRPNLFQLDAPAMKRTFYLQAESKDEAESWMSSLARAATMSGQLSGPFDVQQLHHAEFDKNGALLGLPEGWNDVLGLAPTTAATTSSSSSSAAAAAPTATTEAATSSDE